MPKLKRQYALHLRRQTIAGSSIAAMMRVIVILFVTTEVLGQIAQMIYMS